MSQPSSEAEGHAQAERAEATGQAECRRLMERWNQEHLPALEHRLGRLAGMERAVESATGGEIAVMIDDAQTILQDIWTIHFRTVLPMLLALQAYDEFYADLFGGTEGDAHALLLGTGSESLKAGFGLCDLAGAAKRLGLEQVFRDTESSLLMDTLQASDAGRAFIPMLRDYLDAYGLRQDLFDFATPTWREAPEIALSGIRSYLQTGRDERAEYEATSRSAEELISAARIQLTSYPEAVRGQFEGMLKAARDASFLHEEHNFYIDQQGMARLRFFFLAVGRVLARDGVMDAENDVFMLLVEELRDAVAHPEAAESRRLRDQVGRRRQELTIARTLTPPPFIGVPPAGPPPDNLATRASARFFGSPPQRSESPSELMGNPGSRGNATGPARVARTLEEAGLLQPGEVLVSVTTLPSWTPLFGIAAAVVTETGGPLSHCAIVAREYGIPAVVGAQGATARIVTGQVITVDGARGVVSLDG